MNAFKYSTVIKPEGIIKIPELAKLENQEIEIIVMLKTKAAPKQSEDFAKSFSSKWRGLLKEVEIHDYKSNRIESIIQKNS